MNRWLDSYLVQGLSWLHNKNRCFSNFIYFQAYESLGVPTASNSDSVVLGRARESAFLTVPRWQQWWCCWSRNHTLSSMGIRDQSPSAFLCSFFFLGCPRVQSSDSFSFLGSLPSWFHLFPSFKAIYVSYYQPWLHIRINSGVFLLLLKLCKAPPQTN